MNKKDYDNFFNRYRLCYDVSVSFLKNLSSCWSWTQWVKRIYPLAFSLLLGTPLHPHATLFRIQGEKKVG